MLATPAQQLRGAFFSDIVRLEIFLSCYVSFCIHGMLLAHCRNTLPSLQKMLRSGSGVDCFRFSWRGGGTYFACGECLWHVAENWLGNDFACCWHPSISRDRASCAYGQDLRQFVTRGWACTVATDRCCTVSVAAVCMHPAGRVW